MTTKQMKAVENVELAEKCMWCGGEGVVEQGEFDDVHLVDCICKVEEREQKFADSHEE